jgi:hypothetical protein
MIKKNDKYVLKVWNHRIRSEVDEIIYNKEVKQHAFTKDKKYFIQSFDDEIIVNISKIHEEPEVLDQSDFSIIQGTE